MRSPAWAVVFLLALAASRSRGAESEIATPGALLAVSTPEPPQPAAASETVGSLAAADSLAPAPATVQLTGRFDQSDPAGPRFAWPASAISARFSGTSLSVRLRDGGSNAFEVLIDGTRRGVLSTGPSRDVYTLATGLGPGDHEVTISKRTEAFFGEVQFLGFVAGDGGQLEPASAWRPARRIEFIGDSITAGYGDEGDRPTCPSRSSNENEFLAYGAIAARELGAEHVTIAWSGKTVGGMAALYDRVLPSRAGSQWDHGAWVPDVVVINLGTNDVARTDLRDTPFTSAYAALLARVREWYPRAFIVCAIGPMLSDGYPAGARMLTRARSYTQAAVDEARSRGDERIEVVEFPTQNTNVAGCGFHPGLQSHREMADRLADEIRSAMGW